MIATGEAKLFLARHPANTVYFIGSALVFATVFTVIADQQSGGAVMTYHKKMKLGFETAVADATTANSHMNKLLYGFILYLLNEAIDGGLERAEQVRLHVIGAPDQNGVALPGFMYIPGHD